jgi:hypothetical protein
LKGRIRKKHTSKVANAPRGLVTVIHEKFLAINVRKQIANLKVKRHLKVVKVSIKKTWVFAHFAISASRIMMNLLINACSYTEKNIYVRKKFFLKSKPLAAPAAKDINFLKPLPSSKKNRLSRISQPP